MIPTIFPSSQHGFFPFVDACSFPGILQYSVAYAAGEEGLLFMAIRF